MPDQLNLPPNTGADLNLTINIENGSTLKVEDRPKVSMIAIPDFVQVPHTANHFVAPTAVVPDLIYTYTIQNFEQFDRVVVIITNIKRDLGGDGLRFSYQAEIVMR